MSRREFVSEFKIIIGDLFQELNSYPNFFNLIIADPPFGIDYNKTSHEYGSEGIELYEDKFTDEEYEEFSFNWISKCYDSLKDDGSMYIVSGWTRVGEILNAIKKTQFELKNHIIWSFEWGVYTKRKYITSHYHILFLVKGKNYTFNPQYYNPKSERKKKPYEKDSWYWKEYNRGNDPDRIKGHPCQLPIMLLKKMIRISSNIKDWVGDIFSGSGGTLIASRELGRNCISIEKKEEFKCIIEEKAKVDKDIIGYDVDRNPSINKYFNYKS